MGIYGSMLTYWQAQFIDLKYFDMLPLVNAGWDKTKDRDEEAIPVDDEDNLIYTDIRGCFQNLSSNTVKNSNGNLTIVVSGNLWTDTKLSIGKFVKDSLENYVYRIEKENTWNREGDFYYYDVVQVVGDDGQLTITPDFNLGTEDYT